jgi:hypothetical protein
MADQLKISRGAALALVLGAAIKARVDEVPVEGAAAKPTESVEAVALAMALASAAEDAHPSN